MTVIGLKDLDSRLCVEAEIWPEMLFYVILKPTNPNYGLKYTI